MDNSNSGKSGLVHDLMAKGFTARKSEEAVNAVFDSMRRALARGETVEVPGGSLRAQIRNGKPYKQHFKKRRNINTGKLFYPRVVSYPGRRRVVKFDPDLNLNLDHCAEYPPPTIPASVSFRPSASCDREQAEAWKLAAELLRAPVDTAIMAVLQESAERYSDQPGALLHMLRRRRERGYRPPTVEALANDLARAGFR